jgi:hypothetical protein
MAKTPKDFSGQNKKSDAYDKDWVFHNGAWQTKRQRKSDIAGQKQQKAYLAGINNPATPTAAAAATTGTGAMVPIPGAPTGAAWTKPIPVTNSVANTPAWWMGQAIANPDENQAFANAANAIMPLLSPEDAMNMGGYLATNYKDQFGQYANLKLPIPTELTNERNEYLSSQRAQQAIGLLDRMQTAAGGDQSRFGKGYDFLRNAINLLNKFQTNGSPMTREQYAQFQNAFQGLQSGAGKDIQAYANLAQMFSLPSFTAGPLVSNNPNAKLIP